MELRRGTELNDDEAENEGNDEVEMASELRESDKQEMDSERTFEDEREGEDNEDEKAKGSGGGGGGSGTEESDSERKFKST